MKIPIHTFPQQILLCQLAVHIIFQLKISQVNFKLYSNFMDRTISHIICRRFLQMYKFNIVFLFNSHRSMQNKTNLGKMSTTCTDNEFLGETFTLQKGNRFYLQLQELYLKN